MSTIIEQLRDDANYFGDLGRQYFSNSDIQKLLKAPDKYGEPWKSTVDFEKGKYIHHKMLQPELFAGGTEPMQIIDVATRNNGEYRDAVKEAQAAGNPNPIFLLRKEIGELDWLVEKMEFNEEFRRVLQGDREEFDVEEPAIGQIRGYWFKGKADRINRTEGIVADLKTARNLDTFRMLFKKHGYHAQAYIYRELFGLPVRFYVVSKEDGRLGIYDVCEETLEAGEAVVRMGLERYESYFGEDAKLDINQFVDYDVF